QDQKCEIVNGCGMGSVTEEDVEDGTVSFTIAGFPDGLYDLYLIQLTGDEYISDVLCVKNVEPSLYIGWTEVGGKKYYFCPKNDPNWEDNLNELNEHVNARGAMAVGAVWMPDGLLYKFGPDGALEKIWHRIKNVTIDDIPEDAEAASALNTLQRGETYRLSVNYIPEEDGLSEEEISDDQTLHFTSKNPNAVRVDDDGTLHALQVTGSPVEITVTTGDEDNRYHPTAAIMVSVSAPAGWFAVDGNRFYGKKTGTGVSLAEGWQAIGPDTYYFYPGDDTKHVPYSLATGVVKIGSSCYAFDAYGARICEAQAVDGTFLYDGKYYAFDGEGDLYRDTFFDMTVGGKNRTYYANAAGELATGICTFGTGEKRYFADADYALAEEEPVCSMQNGLVIADDNAYYFTDYKMQYGYFAAGTEHYYATPAGKSGEGSLQYGAVKVGDQILLFGAPWSTKPYAQIGEAAPKSWIIAGGKRYYLNASGRTLNGFQTIDSKRYFFRSDGSALTGAFMDYYFGETDHYGYPDDNYGIMQTGRQYYNGSYYFHAKNGQRLEGWQFDPVSGIWDYYTPEAAGTAHVPPNPTLTDANWHLYGTQYYYYKNNKTLATSWQTINGKKYYFEPAAGPSKGAMYTGFKKIGNAFYYFGENAADLGILQTGTFDYVRGGETYRYYANNSGVLQLGWQKIVGTWHYFDRNTGYETVSVHGEGWSTAKDSLGTEYRYYFINGRTMATGIRLIEGKYYYFSRNTKDGSLGRLVTGTFFKEGSNVYYADEEGVLQTGELVIDAPSPYEGTYYLNEKRVLLTGWQKIGGTWRYFTTAADVALAPGTRCLGREWTSTDAGGWYRLSETGVLSPEDDWFYFPNDKSFVKGWKTIGTDKYYFEKDGRMQRGVFAIGKNAYRTHTENAGHESGICYTDEWYVYNHPADGTGTERLQYYKANGMQQSGWKGKYYFAPAESADGRYDRGDMYTGVSAIGKTLYLFDANGQSRRSETVVLAANAPRRITPEMTGTYATNGRGAILTGLKTINKQKYYFDPLTGKMATGFVTIGKKTYCFDENGVMSLGRVSDRGMYYYLGSNGIMKYGWITEGKKKLYADPVSGALAVGFATIDGKTYYFSEEKATIGELMTGFFHVSDLGQRNYDRSPNASNLYYAYPDGTLHAPGWDVISQSSAKYTQKWSYYFSENIIGYTAAGEAVRGEMAAGDVQMQSDGTVVFLGTLGNLFMERPDIDPLDYYRFDPATGARKKAVLVFYGNYYGEADYTYDWEEEKVTKVTPRISKPQTDIVHSMSKYTNPDRKLADESADFYYVNSNRQEEQQKLYTAGLTSYDPAVTTFPMAASKYYPYDSEHPESRLYWAGNDISDPSGAPGDGNVDVYDVEAYSWDVYQHALKKFGPNNLVLLGASSGGGLCLALCQKAAEEGLMQPANTILFSPWVDLAMDNDAIALISPERSEFLDLGTAKYWAARYTRDNTVSEDYRLAGHGDALGVANPFASPLRGTHLGDLSNVVVYTGGYDLFCPDCKLAVDEITKNGGSAELKYYPSMIHAYMFNKSTLNPSVETVHDACRRIMTQ
ncbi:MAG: alpha/beta hydrolase fold domain-containing protein, partial [Lachnospiraceae bacterium]|nr:alpha/beta hydrolase fold domain-containing protein [Lachnospiraceae bacterium]